MPQQCFISVRVGDTQKLSRLATDRVYRFPEANGKHFGKIEVFKRIGAGSVDIGPHAKGNREVSVDCRESGFGNLKLRINVDQNEPVKPQTPHKAKHMGKLNAAKEYLSKHGLELQLSEAMQVVLREQPDHPAEFLAAMLMGSSPRGVRLPPMSHKAMDQDLGPLPARPIEGRIGKPRPNSRPGTLAPLKGSDTSVQQPQGPQTMCLAYYKQNFLQAPADAWSKINSKFPARGGPSPFVVEAAKRSMFRFNPSVGTWLAPRITYKNEFHLKPSVGTWLAPRPVMDKRPRDMQEDTGPGFEASRAHLVAWVARPSVGTWMAKPIKLKTKDVPPSFAFRPSVGTWVAPRTFVDEVKEPPFAPPKEEVILPNLHEHTKFVAKPSVGTWLAKPVRLKQVEPQFKFKASVGSWLAHRIDDGPAQPNQLVTPRQKCLMSTRDIYGPVFFSTGIRPGMRVI